MMTLTSMALLFLISSYHRCQPSRFWWDSPDILASVLISPAFSGKPHFLLHTAHTLLYIHIAMCRNPLPHDVLCPFRMVINYLRIYSELWQSRMWACSIIWMLRWRPLQLRLPTPPKYVTNCMEHNCLSCQNWKEVAACLISSFPILTIKLELKVEWSQ